MRRRKLFFAVPALVLGLLVMIYAGFSLLETRQTHREGVAVYEDWSNLIKRSVASDLPYDRSSNLHSDLPPHIAQTVAAVDSPRPQSEEAQIYIPAFDIDFELLQTLNKDSAAWLYSPGTVIDYPVMMAEDYYYYLGHLPDGTANANGSLFVDFNNAPDFSEELTVIYGHHMKSGSMFGSLVGYKEQQYYYDNPYMYLYTQNGDYRIDLIYGFVISAEHWKERAFMFAENVDALLGYAAQNTTFLSGASFAGGDRVVALSTCSYEFNDARYVVLGALRS